MNKIYFIIVLFVAAFFSGCTKDETAGMPTVEVGAMANLSKDATTESNLPPDGLATMDVKFDVDVLADDPVSKVEITVSFNDGQETGVYEVVGTKKAKIEVTLARLLDALPDLSEADFVKGSKVAFYATEIVMEDGRVFNNDSILTNQTKEVEITNPDGTTAIVKKPVYITPANNTGDFTEESAVFHLEVAYYIACASELEGEYTVVSSMTSTDGGAHDNPTVDFPYDGVAVFTKVTPISYEVSSGLGGMYKRLYGHWGAGLITVKYLDLCGDLVDNGTKGTFGASFEVTSSSVDPATGVITVEWTNDWGDTGKNVYTPKK